MTALSIRIAWSLTSKTSDVFLADSTRLDSHSAAQSASSHTTPYHPMGDGLVEHMNRSLLNLLRTFTEKEGEWEKHLQLLLFLYRTTKHASTGMSPYELLFGSNPPSLQIPDVPGTVILEPSDYSMNLKSKLLHLREIVDVESAYRQGRAGQDREKSSRLLVGQKVLLNNPTRGKLDPRWTGPWTVSGLRGPTTVLLRLGSTDHAVHMNRVRPLLTEESKNQEPRAEWSPPLFHHEDDVGTSSTLPSAPPSDPQQQPVHSSTAGAAPPSSEETEEMHAEPPDLEATSTTRQACPPCVTTRSGRAVKPVEHYGHV